MDGSRKLGRQLTKECAMYKKILVPVDLSDIERGKASVAIARHVGGEDCSIKLLYVIEDIPAYVATELPTGILDKTADEARATLNKIAASEKNCTAEVRSGRAQNVILSTAEEFGADLIIVGSHKPGLQDYLIGSTAARVVRHSKCTVLVSR